MKLLVVSADRSDASGRPQNLGDALLTDALVQALRAGGADARALDLGDADRIDGAPRVRVGGVRGLSAAIGSSDGVILGGGTLFADDQPDARYAGLPRLCAVTAGLTRLHGRRFAAFGVGVDPMRRRRARQSIRFAARRGRVWVREESSAARLEAIAGRRPRVAADVALLGADDIASRGAAASDRQGVVIALNRTEARALTVGDVDALSEEYGAVRFVSMDRGGDSDASALGAGVRDRLSDVVEGAIGWQDAADAIGSARALVASRMHAMYLGAMTGTPMAILAATPKTVAFAAEFDVPVIDRPGEGKGRVRPAQSDAVGAASVRAEAALQEVTRWLTH